MRLNLPKVVRVVVATVTLTSLTIAMAIAQGGVSRADYERASQAALKAAGGGTVNDVDRENEAGATWEVEITKADGTRVEVQLDAQFNVMSVGSEQDDNEGPGDNDSGPDDD